MDLLAEDAIALSAVIAASERRPSWARRTRWRRIWAGLNLGRAQPWSTLVYETVDPPRLLCTVDVFEDPPNDEHPPALHTAHDRALGWLRVVPFPGDARLHTLPNVLERTTDPRVVRYVPRKRCTLSTRQDAEALPRFVKVFPDGRGAVLHDEGVAVWDAHQRGELDFDVAPPLRWEEETNSLWQGGVAGEPLRARLMTDSAPSLAARICAAAGSIAASSLTPRRTYDAAVQLERTSRQASDIRPRFPQLTGPVENLLGGVAELHLHAGGGPPRPLHGSPHVSQWLHTTDRLGLVDFDRVSMGDPELDAATFIAEIDYEDPTKYPVDALNTAFLDGYQSVAGRLDESLLRAYRAHRHFAKAHKAARAVRTGAERRTARNLRRAMACLRADR
ncbi:MAG: phosphotransferase family protein [Acidimicrobiia bacterium]